jgi:hypothetical protein
MIILVGNHTRKNNRVSVGPDHTLADLSTGTDGLWIIEEPQILKINDVEFGVMPYIDPPAFNSITQKYLPRLYDVENPLSFVIGHQEVAHSQTSPGHFSSCAAVWTSCMPPLISGHLHQRHTHNNCFWPGTPMQHSLNETTDKYIHFGTLVSSKTTSKWTKQNGCYESSCGKLYEYPMINIPIRTQRVIDISELSAISVEVYKNDIDYWKITVTYSTQADSMVNFESRIYNDLVQKPRVSIQRRQLKEISEIPQIKAGTGDNFAAWLQKAPMSEQVYTLLKKIGNW